MKKVLLSVALMIAVCATASVMAQDTKKDSNSQKTECPKKSDDKKCCKSEESKCTKDADKKCCKEKSADKK